MTILDFVRMLRANLKLLLIGLVLGALLGFGYSLFQPRVYASSSTGYVTVGDGAGIGDVISGSTAAKEKAAAYLALVNSGAVADEIIAANPELNLTRGQIQGSLSATVDSNSALINVSATASSPEASQALANSSLEAVAKVANDLDGSSAVRVIPLEDATLNQSPVSPDTKKLVLMGAGGGLALVLAAVLLRRTVDTKLRTRDDATKATDSGVLGVLPISEELTEENILRTGSDHTAQESIRQMRTNLRFVNVDNPPKSLIVTSAEPGEGKSTVSTSIARALADAGAPVIIIDADLRRPTIAKKFKIDSKVGLTQVLAGQVELADAVRQFEDTQLFILPAGRIPPNPSELLGSDKMHQLISELSGEFTVVVDVPPVLPVTDAALLSTAVDGVVLVATVGKTRKENLAEATSNLRKVSASILGVVINRAPRTGLGNSYYGFAYSSTGAYTSYYGSEEKGKKTSKKRKKKNQASA
ncbi:polysaccharide biosynthesis tyrosine autokinase [Rothia nasimurium]|uniref:Polysaccharide biosynthesis tyrosine autokinase n=1 Tax=Rothia nasimurium TaxID=85336 RepID=A0A4Y9F894_9MICC|nr:polysaccharide biosynthesis tyrosine autokinase [Rothia nasimurium]MBF0807044.1 polysaccharide biosynthesis tyrosine autokinase [Rothia nasimurium]TFU24367.1 polysaccharide biosynthesis tyrosine autokinase [Rothia nasimurium]